MKQKVSYLAIGLFIGLIVGFYVTNYLNRPEFTPGNRRAASGSMGAQQAPAEPPTGEMPAVSEEQIAKAKANADEKPDSYTDQLMTAELLLRMSQRPEEAVPYYERASKLKPTDAKPIIGLGDAYLMGAESAGGVDNAKLEKAAEYYEKALAVDPKNVTATTHLGVTYLFRKPADADRAIAHFKKSLEIKPDDTLTMIYYARALTDKGDVAGAEQVIGRLESIDPNSPALAQLKDSLAHARGDHPPHDTEERIPTH